MFYISIYHVNSFLLKYFQVIITVPVTNVMKILGGSMSKIKNSDFLGASLF